MVLGLGIDPRLQAPQTRVLPLHYPSILDREPGFEPGTDESESTVLPVKLFPNKFGRGSR